MPAFSLQTYLNAWLVVIMGAKLADRILTTHRKCLRARREKNDPLLNLFVELVTEQLLQVERSLETL
jgi:hypothetical protein